MGLTNLESLDEFIACNRANYRAYARHLAGVPGVQRARLRRAAALQLPVRRRSRSTRMPRLTRDELVAVLHAENVMARRYFHPGRAPDGALPVAFSATPTGPSRAPRSVPGGPRAADRSCAVRGRHRASVRDPATALEHGASVRDVAVSR